MTSNEGDIVADFFCGSGTTLVTAEKLNRRWIGVDFSDYAVELTKKRFFSIKKSKNLVKEGEFYEKVAKPFEVLILTK